MSLSFDPGHGLIVVPTEIEGPTGSAILRLALDTGATSTVVNSGLLVAIGYDLALAPDRVEMTTGSGIEYAPRLAIIRLTAIGHSRENVFVLGHTLPQSTGVDGLLGLDFFRNSVLTIDFRDGSVELL